MTHFPSGSPEGAGPADYSSVLASGLLTRERINFYCLSHSVVALDHERQPRRVIEPPCAPDGDL